MSLKHVMLDLETFGTSPYSTIIMIGAAVFDPYTDDPNKMITNRFEVAIDPKSYQARIDAATVMWWMDRERDPARTAWLSMSKVTLSEALDGFSEWIRYESADVRVWGNGSDFDNVLLSQAYEMMKRDAPWNFRHNRCFRTLRALSIDETMQYLGTQHTALADAVNQAVRANQIVRKLGIKLT
jgi:exodeoxyribonuclease VIII